MNYASKILGYLSETEREGYVLLVGGAPAVEKTGDSIKIVFNAVLTPEDIRDTLLSFVTHCRRAATTELTGAGVFSFGMPNMGRFRVHYAMQRGSMMVGIQRMPFDIPTLEQIIADPGQIAMVRKLIENRDGGLVMITGDDLAALSELSYVLLQRINETRGTVICVCEETLTYALRHKNSVVIQIELGTDVPTLEEALHSTQFMHPGVVYARNCRTKTGFDGLIAAAEAGSLVILSMVAHESKSVMQDIKLRLQGEYSLFRHHLLGVVNVSLESSGKMKLSLSNKSELPA